ncbi:restriction endonuclease subunit S [Shewanella algae]|uniref:restriction endonuclease subunit S n=1 Tax=Shewanella algae TaxID=38313 RepID=UPI0038B2AAAC
MNLEALYDLADEVRESYIPTPDEDVPYVGLEHVSQQTLQLLGRGSSLEVESNKYKFKKGDILFGTLRPYFRKIIIAPFDGVCSTEYSVIRPKDSSKANFVFYFLANEKFIEYATTNSVGARPRTKWKLFSDYKIRKTTDQEKTDIGIKLRCLDDLIENNRRRIQLLEESARLLYQEWFVHLRFPGHEQVKIIDGVPEGWEKKPLKEIATLNYGKALKAEVRIPGPFPVYGSSGEVGSHEKPLVKGPGIVIGRKGNVGSVYWVNTDFYPIDTVYFISAEESSLFLYHALQNIQFINTDVAVPGLNRNMAYSREILVPDDKNFHRFLSEVVPIQEQINKLQDYSNKLAQARDLLLPKLMSGELTV